MTDKRVTHVTVLKHYDDGSSEQMAKINPATVAAILAAGLAVMPKQQQSGTQRKSVNSDTCPAHGTAWTIRPAGSNAERGTSWQAFWKCDGKDDDGGFCKYRPA